MVNIRTKGASAERDVADDLNLIINACYVEAGLKIPTKPIVQRNQNQTAVGGKDLVGTFGLAIEVKRQENLNINTWWKQCVASAEETGEIPVLLFRQSRQKWRCITYVQVTEGISGVSIKARGEISYDDFSSWFQALVRRAIRDHKPLQEETLFG